MAVVLRHPATIELLGENPATWITAGYAKAAVLEEPAASRISFRSRQAMMSDSTLVDIGAPPPMLGAAGSNARSIVSRMSDVLPAAV